MENRERAKLPRQFILYTVIGLSSTVVQYLTYVIVLQVCGNYYAANGAGFVISVLNSFYWNQRFVFQCEEGRRRAAWKALLKTYAMYFGTGIVLTSILLHLFIEKLGLSEYVAPIVIVVLIYPLNFAISKFWAYRTEATDENR